MTTATLDHRHVWHPFTQAQTAPAALPIVRGEGAYLYGEDGKAYCDLISSWWVNLHGHAHPAIAAAIAQQAATLEHVLFAGFTHAPAAQLAEQLVRLLPDGLARVFFSDNGSTAVEIALKMSYQYWFNQGVPQRRLFVAFEGAYHGDTFGAMAAARETHFFAPFQPFLFDVRLLPYPDTWQGDDTVALREAQALARLDALLEKEGEHIAALIVEPLLQGASGMRLCRAAFLDAVVARVRAHGILVIFDEVMTGFGRTGRLFACQHTHTVPDLICLSKGLTGGFLPLAATVASEAIHAAFLGEHFSTALAHGHSYTGNPLGCAAALASLALFKTEATLERIVALEAVHHEKISPLVAQGIIQRPRVLGSVAAFEIGAETGYGAAIGKRVQETCLEAGLVVRPLGNVVYLLPPYCLTPEELSNAYDQLARIVTRCLRDTAEPVPQPTGARSSGTSSANQASNAYIF